MYSLSTPPPHFEKWRLWEQVEYFSLPFWWLFDWFDCLVHLDGDGTAIEGRLKIDLLASGQDSPGSSALWFYSRGATQVQALLLLSKTHTLPNILRLLLESVSSQHPAHPGSALLCCTMIRLALSCPNRSVWLYIWRHRTLPEVGTKRRLWLYLVFTSCWSLLFGRCWYKTPGVPV